MNGHVVGERVGAFLGAGDNIIAFLGYGVYQGVEVPPKEIGGLNLGFENPKIVLDNGDVVWGCECWWGAESRIKGMIEAAKEKGYDIIDVLIADARFAAKEAAVKRAEELNDGKT